MSRPVRGKARSVSSLRATARSPPGCSNRLACSTSTGGSARSDSCFTACRDWHLRQRQKGEQADCKLRSGESQERHLVSLQFVCSDSWLFAAATSPGCKLCSSVRPAKILPPPRTTENPGNHFQPQRKSGTWHTASSRWVPAPPAAQSGAGSPLATQPASAGSRPAAGACRRRRPEPPRWIGCQGGCWWRPGRPGWPWRCPRPRGWGLQHGSASRVGGIPESAERN